MRLKLCLYLFFGLKIVLLCAQEMPVKYELGNSYNDRYKYSNVLSISTNSSEEMVLVRNFYGGMILKPKGYCIEVYDKELNLILEDTYKYTTQHMIDGFVYDNQLYLLELRFNGAKKTYDYIIHQSPLSHIKFKQKTLLSIPAREVTNPLAVNKYHRKFSDGFSTAVYFDDEKSAFAITVNAKRGKLEEKSLYLFGTDLQQYLKYDISSLLEDKNYAFEEVCIAPNLDAVYLMGKAYFKKRRFDAKERRFQYELVKISKEGHRIQEFSDPGRFPEALKPIFVNEELIGLGFYADRKDHRYNGLVYFKIDPKTLDLKAKKYNPFSEQFMLDKFGRAHDKEIKNLVFKDIHVSPENKIYFSAEEYFVTKGEATNATGASIKTERFHYNDIVCAKLDVDGTMEWARNINKAEVTQGDAAYASYTSYGKNTDMYFFINSGENPQQLSKDRMLFKQGYSRNPNVFVLKLDKTGNLSYKKLVDDKEIRLPVMVSKPLIRKNQDRILFYAKRGNKKQLLEVSFNTD